MMISLHLIYYDDTRRKIHIQRFLVQRQLLYVVL